MDKYDRIAHEHGVELEAFTSGYLDLYGSKGVKVLEKFIMANRGVEVISTTELVEFVKREEKEQERFE